MALHMVGFCPNLNFSVKKKRKIISFYSWLQLKPQIYTSNYSQKKYIHQTKVSSIDRFMIMGTTVRMPSLSAYGPYLFPHVSHNYRSTGKWCIILCLWVSPLCASTCIFSIHATVEYHPPTRIFQCARTWMGN